MLTKKILAILVVLLFISIVTFAQKGGKPPKGDTDVAVTSTLNGNPSGPFRIGSDGFGSYTDGADGVQSIIQGIGDWELNARNSSARGVFIDFRDPVDSGNTNAPFASAVRPARFISKCAQLGFKIRDMVLNESRLCPLALAFDFNNVNYRIAMNDANFGETDYVQWTCLSVGSDGRCNYWNAQPNTSYGGQLKAKGELIKGGNEQEEP